MKLPEKLRRYVPDTHDVLAIAGAVAIVRGVWQIHRPSAWIVAGALLAIYAVLSAAAPKPRRNPQ